jgi:hypothetical protein
MPSKRSRGIDRRVIPRVEEEPAEEETVGESEERTSTPKLDMVAFCVTCGCNDASLFSKRMLNLRGRFGERTRRCRACVAAQEPGTAKPAIISRWEAAQAVQLKSAQGWKALVEGDRMAATAGQQTVLAAEGAQRPDASPELQDAEPAAAAVDDRQRKRLERLLGKIAELKRRLSAGDALEATQLAKLGREADVRAELATLQQQQGYVFFPADEEEQEATADERPQPQSARDVNSEPTRDREPAHRSMAFALSREESAAVKRVAEEREAANRMQPKRKKLKSSKAAKPTAREREAPLADERSDDPLASLMSHFHACKSLY